MSAASCDLYLDPYERAGLARNPFVLDETPGVAEPLWIRREGIDLPPPGAGRVVQVIGVCGAGKTSHLLRHRERFGGPYRHVPPGAGRWRPLPVAPVTYWDEADRIPAPLLWISLRIALRAGASLYLGAHRDLAGPLVSAGFEVETLALGGLRSEEVAAWAARRIEAASHGTPRVALPREAAAAVARESGASLRSAGDLLHAWAARQVIGC